MAPPIPACWLAALLAVTLLVACGANEGTLPGDDALDPTDHVFDPEHVLRVEIEIEVDDWDELRHQSRDGFAMLADEDCLEEPWGSPFTYFPAIVTIDGEAYPNVGVRKKGFLGSLHEEKPALKVDLSEYGEVAEFHGVDRLTLNNAISDPSFLRQCLGYGFYRDAGLPASRCSYATVQVNGDDLGLFVNVEPIKKPLLRRYFDDDEGNLYEGTLSDFREGWTGTFEKKTNETENDWSDIEGLVAALEVQDDQLIDALEPRVDLDAFYVYWAAEVLSSHTDGYAWNTNNYYLYADPADGRFHFLPWGIDALLYGEGNEGQPESVFAHGMLARRLFGLDAGRDRYHEAMWELLDGAWHEAAMNDRIDRDRELVLAELPDDQVAPVSAAIESLRDRMEGRRPAVEDALQQGEGWDRPLRESFCFEMLGELSATFETTWGSDATQDVFDYGDGATTFILNDELFELAPLGSVAGDYDGTPIIYAAGWMSETEAALVYVTAPHELITPGVFETGFGESLGALLYINTATMEEWEIIAYVVGQVDLQQAGLEFGDPIVGSITGELLSWGW
jgi:hypothetical protein